MHPKEILKSLEANARKSLSQNFLTSPHWQEKLVENTLKKPCDEIWEIGPGLGALTRKLISLAKTPITLFEYDKKYIEYLKKEFPEIKIVEGDFLKNNLENLLSPQKKVGILSNLPYHLSSPILYKMVEIKSNLSHFVFTFQKEFADRLTAKPKTKEYGALSVITQLHFKMENLGTIPKTAFYPAPEVDSKSIYFTPIDSIPGIKELEKIVHSAFAHRRKMMLKNLKTTFPEIDWVNRFQQAKLSLECRAEDLTKEDFLKLL